MKSKSLSLYSILLILLLLVCIFFYSHLWNKNRIVVDVPSYYTYMPAVFIYHDLHLKFTDTNPGFFKNKTWYYTIENGKRLIKHPVGFSLLLSPFFILGHFIAIIINSTQDGYSLPYQNMVSIGVLFYLFIGLYFLRKILLDYFPEKIVALVLFCIVFGTNMLWYASFEGLMPHCVSFAMLCICIFSFNRWLTASNRKYLFLFSIAFGIAVLIRPLSITNIIYFFIFGIVSKKGASSFLQFCSTHRVHIIIAALITTAIGFIQLCYWKYATGNWFYDVYINEHFIFNSPQLIPFLFSFRKGVFVYTPIFLFAIIGFLRLYKNKKEFFYSTLVLMCLSIYILSSWWAWSYGICWAMRPMIDYYSFLSFPLAAGFAFVFEQKKWLKTTLLCFLVCSVSLQIFQTWQYKNGLIHYDDMSKEAYFKGFFQTTASVEWQDMLKPYDWERRIKGLPQLNYSKKYLLSLKSTDKISLRASNLLYLAANAKASNMIAAYVNGTGKDEMFSIHHLTNDTVCIRSSTGYLLSVKPTHENIIAATELTAGINEKFIFEYVDEMDNRITLKAANGKYLSIDDNFPSLLKADADEISKTEIFRYYSIDTDLGK